MQNFKPACFTSAILLYQPLYGDYLVWSRWFSTWHGFLVEFNTTQNECMFMMSGVPLLLVNSDSSSKSVKRINLDKIRNSKGGEFAVIRHGNDRHLPIWYV